MPSAPEIHVAPESSTKPLLSWFIALSLATILAVHVTFTLQGDCRYREQHLGAALHYAAHGVDLLHPVIVGFNATGTPSWR